MEKLTCSRCGGEFFLHTGCRCGPPPPGPHFCPECGGILNYAAPSYFVSKGWDEE